MHHTADTRSHACAEAGRRAAPLARAAASCRQRVQSAPVRRRRPAPTTDTLTAGGRAHRGVRLHRGSTGAQPRHTLVVVSPVTSHPPPAVAVTASAGQGVYPMRFLPFHVGAGAASHAVRGARRGRVGTFLKRAAGGCRLQQRQPAGGAGLRSTTTALCGGGGRLHVRPAQRWREPAWRQLPPSPPAPPPPHPPLPHARAAAARPSALRAPHG